MSEKQKGNENNQGNFKNPISPYMEEETRDTDVSKSSGNIKETKTISFLVNTSKSNKPKGDALLTVYFSKVHWILRERTASKCYSTCIYCIAEYIIQDVYGCSDHCRNVSTPKKQCITLCP